MAARCAGVAVVGSRLVEAFLESTGGEQPEQSGARSDPFEEDIVGVSWMPLVWQLSGVVDDVFRPNFQCEVEKKSLEENRLSKARFTS